MGFKNIINQILSHKSNKHFKFNSLILNVELINEHLSFTLFNQSYKVASGSSRGKVNWELMSGIKKIIDDYVLSQDYSKIDEMQSKLSKITDDIVPKKIRDFLINNKSKFPYLVIDDENLPYNIPYGVFFFPDSSVENRITAYGFFLSEYYTIIRSNLASDNNLLVNTLGIISSDDLDGSLNEENEISRILGNTIKITPITSRQELGKFLREENPECLHFCCHGTTDNKIVFKKKNKFNEIELDFFNLIRFQDGTLIFLNICLSNYTNYESEIPRSISDKFLDRNTALVIVTEWPISDSFAYTIGTNFYRELSNGLSAVEIVHKLKTNVKNFEEKITALSYSLRGNPELEIKFSKQT